MTVVWPLCPNEAIHGVGFVRQFNATERVVDILRSIVLPRQILRCECERARRALGSAPEMAGQGAFFGEGESVAAWAERYWYLLATGVWYLTASGALLGLIYLPLLREPATDFFRAQEVQMKASERRQLARTSIRTPLRFRALGVAADKTEHFTEALNISRGGFFFASSAPLQVGMPLEATLRMPAEVTGSAAQEMRCTARVVHVRNEPYGDGRIGFGAEIEKFEAIPPQERWAN